MKEYFKKVFRANLTFILLSKKKKNARIIINMAILIDPLGQCEQDLAASAKGMQQHCWSGLPAISC